jgi:hypothetical protein
MHARLLAQGAKQVHPDRPLDADTAEFQRECISLALDAETLEPSVYFLGEALKDATMCRRALQLSLHVRSL